MKKIQKILILSLLVSIAFSAVGQEKSTLPKEKTALLIIDVQMFYFPGGQVPLVHPEKTSLNIKKLLYAFRENNMEVIHIRHDVSKNGAIHPNVKPLDNEKVITKSEANSFNGTELDEYLKAHKISDLVITGMQTHMCVEATTRAAYDLGYNCIIGADAATTRDLTYNDKRIEAKDVHYSTLSTLHNSYGKVKNVKEILKIIQ